MIGKIRKIWRPIPILLTLIAASVLGGSVLFWVFRSKSNNYIDRATAHYIHELIKAVKIPFIDHFDNAAMNLQLIDEYMGRRYPDKDCSCSELKNALDYYRKVNRAEELLFVDSLLGYTGVSGIEGTLKVDGKAAQSLLKDGIPMTRHIDWPGGYAKYAVAIRTDKYKVDGREYCAFAFIFDPGLMNTFAAVQSYSGAAQLFVMDEDGNIAFSNNAYIQAGNHLDDYVEQDIMTQTQADSVRAGFRSGRHDWLKIKKDGLETFFCYDSGGHNGYSIVMEVPDINARSILTTLQSMLLFASTAIAGLLIVILVTLTVFILLNFHNKALADNEKKVSLAKSAFLSNMSHDIRTPMNAIIGYTTLAIASEDKPEAVKDYLGKIKNSSAHLLSLINDVLEMSRIESGKIQIDPTFNSITVLLTDIEDIVRADVSLHGHTFAIDRSQVIHDVVLCDNLRIRQILLNLLSNAIKYTPDGGRIELTVSESKSDRPGCGHYSIKVRDNGMGMSEEFAKTVFEEFTRERNTTVSGIQGTGLGMAIVKNLVELMHGSIDMHTRQNVGTEFLLEFDFTIGSSVQAEESGTVHTFDFSGKKVLLVEDNELNREIATAILENAGFVVSCADDGSKAVEMVQNAGSGDYDLVLMDIQMPVMNGFEATKHIRALESELSRIPIIAMTANAFEEDRKAAIEAGMNEHIGKPVDIDKLKAVIAKFL